MKKIKILWVDDDGNFGPGVHLRYEDDLKEIGIELVNPKHHLILKSGEYVYETVRTHEPDLIMMDHNLEDVKINGGNLVVGIRLINNEIPIIYYSSEMNSDLMKLVEDENNVTSMQRTEVESSFFTLIKKYIKK
tara:strand:- start:316 stop:717 length:402 start_codon:yes stop_codon:yes gene_type:complete